MLGWLKPGVKPFMPYTPAVPGSRLGPDLPRSNSIYSPMGWGGIHYRHLLGDASCVGSDVGQSNDGHCRVPI